MPVRAVLVAALVACVAAQAYPSGAGTVYLSSGALVFKAGAMDPNGVAWGNFTDQTLHPSAFGRLFVTTNSAYNDTVQAKAAGYLEGALTANRTHQHWDNMNSWLLGNFPGGVLPAKYGAWMEAQDAFMRQMIATNTSDWWVQMSLIVAAFDGLVEGYNFAATNATQLTSLQLAILNAIGDFLDLIPALSPSLAPDVTTMSPKDLKHYIASRGHCSALVKVTGNFSDLFMGHSSWFTYSSMLRVFKTYELNYHQAATASRTVSFSSYPGVMSSLDDFYQMHDSGMGMVQTTNGIYNQSLYKLVTSDGALAWQRVRLACQMANSGVEWANIISEYNSGTYNNQYDVVDLKLFSPGAELEPNTLVVSEQIPGLVLYQDATQELERGYFPSYNVPYIPEIYEKSGYPAMIAAAAAQSPAHLEAVAGLSYQLAPRAKIFRRDQGNVVDMDSFKAILRSNAYTTDPYSKGDPYNAICSRGDLEGYADGCYDTKVTSATWAASRRADVLNGPTTAGDTLPPFSWTPSFTDAHEGQPYTYDFTFEAMTS